ncbi:putative house-cleaning noncanonical NTP pyrophosphatase (MazG superfamily) [Bacillus ectoiniformans]|uniref:nucleoside triphosphate pyrophosphohydrolase n=1 Tax=Bacillus ectoiniformans TaxID=1494429 RepID=UPI00195E9E35|nr:nucleoside triphosphate pyrophosphohydrolase [Bacillus ectoiniformans]MBM7648652.1 putative house-cleaning noncanonical NTP pyrophosphatase (MazG superfamily) [Bacillus ectoiniformans]
MPVYNKLVRDRIPEVIEQAGKTFTTRILDEQEYKQELRKKMDEELVEYKTANNDEEAMEELADLLELIHAATKIHGADFDQLESIRKKKADKRGGFDERIYLIEVEDE